MTTKLRIIGGNALKGSLPISGAKNAALPLMTACLLTDETLTLTNCPNLADIKTLSDVLEKLGVEGTLNGSTLSLTAKTITDHTAPYDLVSKMRASILVLGPLVARHGEARVSLPGGCAIGTRPVDIHINGLRALGCDIELSEGYIVAKAPKGIPGGTYTMPIISVTGTENLMMAAALAKGESTLINAAREPEIINLAECLNAMGAKITGAGTDTIKIQGVDRLHGTTCRIIPDRIETGTYAIAAAITGGELTLTNTDLSLIPTVSSVLSNAGMEFTETPDGFHVRNKHTIKGVDVMTEPFPGFATDLQAQTMALMTICQGASMITESIFENRFMHVPELCRMGANITVHGSSAMIRGVPSLSGAPVMATDLRASFCLVLAALSAKGETTLSRIYHLDRGYERVEEKLSACGAIIERIQE